MSFSRLVPRCRLGLGKGAAGRNPNRVGRNGFRCASSKAVERDDGDDSETPREFLPLKIKPDVEKRAKFREYVDLTPAPRAEKMDPDQDWTNVWSTGATFRHSATPFPVRMGVVRSRIENDNVVPDKSINVELLKVSNFLHLTPHHVENHCEVMKQFCTEWPEGLESEEDFDKHFPVEVTTRDFVYNWSLRDERSKVNEVKVKLSALHLDHHARDKIVRLAEGRRMIAPDPAEEELKKTQIGIEGNTPMNLAKERTTASYNITHLNERRPDPETGEMKWRRRRMYGWWDKRKHWLNPEVHALQEDLPEKTPIADYDYESDKVVLTTQQCPTRKQNYDHAMFLIKALYGEAWKQEAWEDEKELEDLERFIWDKSGQKEAGLRLYRSSYPDNAEKSDEELLATPELTAYREAVEELVNYGETDERMAKYKAAVKKLMAVGE